MLIPTCKKKLIAALARAKVEYDGKLQNKIKNLVQTDKKDLKTTAEEDKNTWKQVTVQADKGMDFQTVRKVLFTVTEAGAGQINFAVLKQALK
jgi:biopolymer transport protein ExbD